MATLTRKRIRLGIDADKGSLIKDQLTGATPELWRGNDVQFELGILWNALVADLSNLADITLTLRVDDALGALAATVTVEAADLNLALTDAQWAAKTHYHALIPLTGAETNLAFSETVKEKTYHLVVDARTTDTPARTITLGVTTLKLREDGAGTAGVPPTNDPLYRTIPQEDAAFTKKIGAPGEITRYVSPSGRWAIDIGVRDDGSRLDDITDLNP